jgi:hypothetical protein
MSRNYGKWQDIIQRKYTYIHSAAIMLKLFHCSSSLHCKCKIVTMLNNTRIIILGT